jgi:HAD superfamily hydrolase (TIGR01549 family)
VLPTAAVFFDVDFTLIHPGPRFQATGYHETCTRHGVIVDPSRFDAAVAGAAEVLDDTARAFNPQVYINYTARIIELMGGDPAASLAPAEEIYEAWGAHHHFTLYDDVEETLRLLFDRGVKIGLITNGHRPLESFSSHFEIEGLISCTLSSAQHGYMKPHASIFRAALALAGVSAQEAVMVGDSYDHDVAGAEAVGMRGVLIDRSGRAGEPPRSVAVIRSLKELPDLV